MNLEHAVGSAEGRRRLEEALRYRLAEALRALGVLYGVCLAQKMLE